MYECNGIANQCHGYDAEDGGGVQLRFDHSDVKFMTFWGLPYQATLMAALLGSPTFIKNLF